MKVKKILYVIPRLARAGTEKHLLALASGLDKSRFVVSICCLFEKGLPDGDLSGEGLEVFALGKKSVYDPRIMLDLFRIMKKDKFEIVHSYLFGFHYLAAIPAKLVGVKTVISSRRELAGWKKQHHHLLENLGNSFTDKVVACSDAVKGFALCSERLSPEKITTIYNGVELNLYYPREKKSSILREFKLTDADTVIGMVTKLEKVKDVETALRAVAETKKVHSNLKFIIVGDGPLRKKLQLDAVSLGLSGNTIFTGNRDDIPDLLSIFDVFLLTSLSEGLPNAVLEAMACGKTVISTKVGGVAEVIANGSNGFLVDTSDCKEISKIIVTLLKDMNIAAEIGRQARLTIENRFNSPQMISKYEDLYQNSLVNN